MTDYLLFIDTETSGLPKRWDLPYSTKRNWPSAIQVSWIVFSKDGQKIKEESKYIWEKDILLSPAAHKIHGLTKSFLENNGSARKDVLDLLVKDLQEFQPMVVGHFMELDFHVIGADFYRAGIENPMVDLPSFCTMLATTHLVSNPQVRFLKLGELYQLLFERTLLEQHNALVDAKATAKVFFELQKRKEITGEPRPPIALPHKIRIINRTGWAVVALIVILFIILISHYL